MLCAAIVVQTEISEEEETSDAVKESLLDNISNKVNQFSLHYISCTKSNNNLSTISCFGHLRKTELAIPVIFLLKVHMTALQ